MKRIVYGLCAFALLLAVACDPTDGDHKEKKRLTPEEIDRNALVELDIKFSNQWTEAERKQANSAVSADYLTQVEKEVYYYLNLMRINPPRFAETYAKAYNGSTGWENGFAFDERKDSLLRELAHKEPMPVLVPDYNLFRSADCFANNCGVLGLTGHDRTESGCGENPGIGECCDYWGCHTGYAIIMRMLIDAGENNADLGHRFVLLYPPLTKMGAAVRDHINFEKIAVLDFGR
jgi:hypothetical protein